MYARELEATEEAKEPFIIDSQEKAAWVMRKLRQIEQKKAENNDTANNMVGEFQKEIEGVQAWQKGENDRLDNDASWFIAGLETWHRKQYEEDNDIKTIKLPFGKLEIRAQQPEYIRDANKLKLWVKEIRPDCLETIEKPKWDELKKSIKVVDGQAVDTTNGFVIDGVTVVEREAKFNVKVEV